ncbi:UNVERIFIED_CONTAM: hypothetical protein Sradi_3685900 [Sesamum radiatum]|uniref:Transmembrane protein n=1 Tax=Sesamum radiatum TaxID=300843 RepID=A0AAW2PWY2_SESRA
MSRITGLTSLRFFSCLLSSFVLLLIPGLADNSSTPSSSDENKAASKKPSRGSTGLKILIVCLGLIAVGAFSVFLFKLWQRRREKSNTHAF